MSNLIKQQFIAGFDTQRRIINSDEIAEERIRERLFVPTPKEEFTDQAESEDGFRAGLAVEVLDVVPEENVEDILGQAKEDAERILENARQEAEQILEDARSRADAEYFRKKQEGYEEGKAQREEEIQRLREEVEQDLQLKAEELERLYKHKEDVMEHDIVEAIIQVFVRVFHIQFEDKKEILLHLVKNTLMNIEVGREFRIRVSEINHRFLENHLDDIKERIGSDINIEIINDANMNASDCVIETDSGVFNCGIDMELSNLVNDIRSLCSNTNGDLT